MGVLIYAGDPIEFDDRLLAHLQVVVSGKLRRSESFFVSWAQEPDVKSGRVSLWLSPSIPLRFEYSQETPPTLNPEWLTMMAVSAGSNGGLVLTAEPTSAEVE